MMIKILLGVSLILNGVFIATLAPEIISAYKRKMIAKKKAKEALRAQMRAQELYNRLEEIDDETLRKYVEVRFRKEYETQECTQAENEAIVEPKNNYKHRSKVAYKT